MYIYIYMYIQRTPVVEHENGMSAEAQQQQRKKGRGTTQSKLIRIQNINKTHNKQQTTENIQNIAINLQKKT